MITIDRIYYRLYNTYGKQKWWPADTDIEMMIGAILVQNTSWLNVEKALANFCSFHAPTILAMDEEELIEIIRPAGFYTRKSQTITNLLTWYRQYDFDVGQLQEHTTEELRKELLRIKGIGEETCDCILLYTFKRPVFVVDSYLKRLLLKTGHPVSKSYKEIQGYMMARLPLDVALFQEYHALIVAYGKDYLKPKDGNDEHDPLVNLRPTIEYSLKQLHAIKSKSFIEPIIETFGYVERPSYPDPFWGIVYAIIGQLISAKAAHAIMSRFVEKFPTQYYVTAASLEALQSVGLTKAKANYIHQVACEIENGKLSLDKIHELSDEEAITYLCKIKGIGVWSAKVILMHSFNYMNISIYEDIALQNAIKKQHNISEINRETFTLFMDDFAPYRTVASIYLWSRD